MLSPPLRVLHVLEALRGGTSRHVADAVSSVRGVEHHVAIPPPTVAAEASGASWDADAVTAMTAAGATVHHVEMRRSPLHPANATAVAQLRALRAAVDATVVHGHSSVGGALARACGAGTGRPVVYTPNGLATGRQAIAAERVLGHFTSRLVAVSESEAELAVRLRIAQDSQVVVIPNGIDLEPARHADVDLRRRLGLPPGTPVVGTVARLVDQKAPEHFVAVCAAVAAALPEPHFLLIGKGPLQPVVDGAVAAAGLGERWHQIPHLAHAASVLDQLDVFVLPSRFEGGPYTPLEAMRAGVPVVLSDVVGNRDAVEHERSGVLSRVGDTTHMADSVGRLLRDPPWRARLVEGAADRLRARFDLRRMGDRLGALYEEVGSSVA